MVREYRAADGREYRAGRPAFASVEHPSRAPGGRLGSPDQPEAGWRYFMSSGRLRSCLRRVPEGAAKLSARADIEFGEHLVQVVLDGSGADEEALTDLGVGVPLT